MCSPRSRQFSMTDPRPIGCRPHRPSLCGMDGPRTAMAGALNLRCSCRPQQVPAWIDHAEFSHAPSLVDDLGGLQAILLKSCSQGVGVSHVGIEGRSTPAVGQIGDLAKMPQLVAAVQDEGVATTCSKHPTVDAPSFEPANRWEADNDHRQRGPLRGDLDDVTQILGSAVVSELAALRYPRDLAILENRHREPASGGSRALATGPAPWRRHPALHSEAPRPLRRVPPCHREVSMDLVRSSRGRLSLIHI